MPLTINGHEYSFASAEIDLRGRKYEGITTFNWSHEVEKGTAEGNGQVALGPTKGPYKASIDFEMRTSEADLFEADLGSPVTEKVFNVGVMYVENAAVSEIQANFVTVQKVEGSNTRGPDATKRKYTLHVWYPIIVNGQTLVPLPDNALVVAPTISLSV